MMMTEETDFFPRLPQDVINKIYEYDPTKRFYFDKVLHQILLRKVWHQLFYKKEFRLLCHFNDTFHTTLPRFKKCAHEYIYDEYDYIVQFQCRWHRILGRLPCRPFEEKDLRLEIICSKILSKKKLKPLDPFLTLKGVR